jgi:hypothetical protein
MAETRKSDFNPMAMVGAPCSRRLDNNLLPPRLEPGWSLVSMRRKLSTLGDLTVNSRRGRETRAERDPH